MQNSGMNKALRKQRTELMAIRLTFEQDIEEWQKINIGGLVLLAHAKHYIVKNIFEGIFNVIGYCLSIENWAKIRSPEIDEAPYIVRYSGKVAKSDPNPGLLHPGPSILNSAICTPSITHSSMMRNSKSKDEHGMFT